MATFIYPATPIDTTGLATEAKQDTVITELQDANTSLTTISGVDFATETTLQNVATETTLGTRATEATLSTLNAKVTTVDTDDVTITSSALPTGAATESTLATLATEATAATLATEATAATLATEATAATLSTESTLSALSNKTKSADVTEAHDYKSYTYVAAGNGAGQVETITYRDGGAAGSIVATQTFTYDASDRVSSITKS
jgi:hypothetical protein